MSGNNKEPYQQAYYPPVPTGFTKYCRCSIIWQFYRFLVINYKMLKLMSKSHHQKFSLEIILIQASGWNIFSLMFRIDSYGYTP